MAHEQGALSGYVHPFFGFPLPDPVNDAKLTNALPIDAALGKVDFYEVVAFAEPRASAAVWYRLLNNGFRIAAAGGSDAMGNYASLHGPIGINRTYVYSEDWPRDPNDRRDAWIGALRDGKSMATNGPLVGLTVAGVGPGESLNFPQKRTVAYNGFLRSAVPLDQLQLVRNGKVIRDIEINQDGMSADFTGNIGFDESGWLLLRASSQSSHRDVFDIYPYATTSPVYIDIGDVGPRSTEDADYFLAWIARVREAASSHPSYNSAEERTRILKHIDAAESVFMNRREGVGELGDTEKNTK